MIQVEKKSEEHYTVTVNATTPSSHEVSLSTADHQKLSGGKGSAEHLIEESFRFLLERESNTMILAQFDLTIIASYFPEYERDIKGRL